MSNDLFQQILYLTISHR